MDTLVDTNEVPIINQGTEKVNDVSDNKQETEKEDEVIVTRGLSGVHNYGGTCYMNATIQALSATKPLLAYLIHKDSNVLDHITKCITSKYTDGDNIDNMILLKEVHNTIPYRLRQILKQMWAINCEIKPKRYKKAIDSVLTFFKGNYTQHDAQEFLSAVLDNIHEMTKCKGNFEKTNYVDEMNVKSQLDDLDKELNTLIEMKERNKTQIQSLMSKIKEIYTTQTKLFLEIQAYKTWNEILKSSYSVINDIFSGLTMCITECTTCNTQYTKFDRFDILTLHLPEMVDINKSSYTIEDLLTMYCSLESDNSGTYFCTYCLEKRNVTRKRIIYHHQNTFVILIKKYQKYNNNIFKSSMKINYNHTLDITPYVSEYSTDSKQYELYSVIRHSGGYGSGHYYTYSKNPINDIWYLFDDGNVYQVKDTEPLDCNGYVLFYRQK